MIAINIQDTHTVLPDRLNEKALKPRAKKTII